MGLFAPQRRWLIALLLAVLTVPGVVMLVSPYQRVSFYENRKLADPPPPPTSRAALRDFPLLASAFLADHFGLRDQMVRAGRKLTRLTGGRVAHAGAVEGQNGWLVLTDGLLRATGQHFDRRRAEDYAAFVCEAADRLKGRGAKLVFAAPPSSVAVYPEAAPRWAGPFRSPREYDVVLERVRACGVAAVDLRAVLLAEKPKGRLLYRTVDSHWTPLGQLVAYNAIVGAFGRPDWRRPPQSLPWTRRQASDGDLPRMAGLPPRLETLEDHPYVGLPPGLARTPLPGLVAGPEAPPEVVETGRPGPSVLIVGDSFTHHPFPPLFAGFVGKVAWVHQEDCAFDWRIVGQVRPDYVLIAPTERELDCGARPRFFDE